MKLLVQTNGDFVLHDLVGQQTVEAFRPCVVTLTSFIENHRGTRLTVLEELADDASDEPLAATSTEEELQKAIAALPRRAKPAPKATPKKG